MSGTCWRISMSFLAAPVHTTTMRSIGLGSIELPDMPRWGALVQRCSHPGANLMRSCSGRPARLLRSHHDGDLMSPEPMHDREPPRRRTKVRRAVHDVWHLKPADFERTH